MRRARVLLCLAACALAAGCGNLRAPDLPFLPFGDDRPEPVDFEALATNPGVYAGRPVALTGLLTVRDGQACLVDRGRRLAVRLTPEQAAEYAGATDRPARVEGVFSQTLCPRNQYCPELCAPHGVEAGARVSGG